MGHSSGATSSSSTPSDTGVHPHSPCEIPTNGSVISLSAVDRLAFPTQDPPPKQLSRLNHIELINVRQCHYVVVYDCILSQDGDYPLDEPPLSEEFIITVLYTFLCYSAYILQLALPPVLSFSMSSSQFVFQFMHATYVRVPYTYTYT